MGSKDELEHKIYKEFGIRSLKKRFQRGDFNNVLPAERINKEKGKTGWPTPFKDFLSNTEELPMQ